ncbi:MAG: tetratricopeptide repeat protein [Bryobacteraceae bacterium]
MIGLLLLLIASTAQGSDLQAEGLQALDHQQFAQAEQIFSKLTVQDPKDYTAFFNLALAETGLQKKDEAIGHYRKALELKPNLFEAELNLAILYLHNRQNTDAVPLLEDAVKQKPDQPRPKRYLADALLASGKPAEARDLYQQALQKDPKLAAAELGLGQSLVALGSLDEAAPHFRQAATLDGNLKSYLMEVAAAFEKANRPADAVPLLKEFPSDVAAREELGRLYLSLNRPADAVEEFQQSVAMSPTPANRLALATAYLKNNQPDLASPILEQALAASPNDYELHMVVGRLRRDRHKYVDAAREFTEAGRIKPDSVEAWNEAATAFVLSSQYPQALAALDKVHSLNGDTSGDLYYRAIVYDKLHQVKQALASYEQFLQSSSGKYPDQEFIARQRSRILAKEANR